MYYKRLHTDHITPCYIVIGRLHQEDTKEFLRGIIRNSQQCRNLAATLQNIKTTTLNLTV